MHVPRGREVPLPGSGHSYTGRGGAGNASGHYLEPEVFERVLDYENAVIQQLKSGEQSTKSGRGGIGNINPHRKDKRNSTLATPRTTIDELDDSPTSPRASGSVMWISDNNPYMRKRSLSVGSTVSSSSAYTGLQHEQSPTATASSSSHIPPNYLLGRRLRPTPSIDSTSSDASVPSTANHHLPYLNDAQHAPRALSPPPRRAQSPPPTIVTTNPLLRLRRGGSSPGTRRPPSGANYIPLQTLGAMRPPAAVPEVQEPAAANRDSIFDAASARLSLSEFPLPPPSPADLGIVVPPSAPPTQASFGLLASPGSPPTRRAPFDPPQKPPPSGPLPVPPQLPAPRGPLPPVPASPGVLPLPVIPTRAPSSDDTIRAPQPKARPSLVGKIPPSSSFLSISGSSPMSSSSPGLRPPPSPSGYFRRRPSTAPIPGPAPHGALSGTLRPPSSPPSSRSSTETLPMSMSPLSPTANSGRMSVTPKGVYTPKVAPEKTAALVRALSLDTSIDGQKSSLDMNDSESGSSAGDHSAPAMMQPRSFFDNPLVDEPMSAMSLSSSAPPSSRGLRSKGATPPLSPALSRSSEDGKKRSSSRLSSKTDSDMRTKLALLAMRKDHRAANAMIFQRTMMGTSTLRL
ncbi:hypothetical protein EXIGLDRAFT_725646 [Exidia glandulosa HHB12029]|uniref:Uncharacterized protein n=1 Tax=Exidia glandulosa HHB12029 TaxID=1314781 RepID=A0A165Q740_EXIGL|nr:hypothetical protein EXIGLDRAFT_725646 [Exidia glandulosa HHB12029]